MRLLEIFKKMLWENTEGLSVESDSVVVYHGSPFRFEDLDPAKVGSTNDKGEPMGFFFTSDRGIAKGFYSKETGNGLGNLLTLVGLGKIKGYQPTVYKAKLQYTNAATADFGGKSSTEAYDKNKIIKQGFKDGHKVVVLTNVIDGPPISQTVYVVTDPSVIKSFEIDS